MPTPIEQLNTIKLGNFLETDPQRAALDLLTFIEQHAESSSELFNYLSALADYEENPESIPILDHLSELAENNDILQKLLTEISSITPNKPISTNLTLELVNLFKGATYLTDHLVNIPDNEEIIQSQLIPIAEHFITQLSTPNASYEQYTQNEARIFAQLTEENKKEDPNLIRLIQKAIESKENYELSPKQIRLIKDAIGNDRFKFLVNRYRLVESAFTLDDLRMLIIGILPNSNEAWFHNDFIKTLFLCYNLEQEYQRQDPAAAQLLRAQININHEVWKRLENTPHRGLINKGLDFVRKGVSEKWKTIVPTRFKANSNFKRDLDTTLSIANISAWQNKPDPIEQQFASNEYLFHKLACANLQDGSVVPVLEANGDQHFYTVKNLINESGVRGFVLVPTDPNESLDLKVVFKSSTNLAKEILDTESYIPHRNFNKHKRTICNNLNKIIADFKTTLPPTQQDAISMNIGGHGTGGSLAQHLINELATYQAAQKHEQSLIEIEERKSLKDKNSASVKDQTEHNENPTELEKQLQETIETQLEYELENGKKITNVEKKQDQIKDYTIKHLLKTKAYLDQIENNQLGSIKHFTLTTTNSGGVPTKVRNNFIQSLALLKQSDSTTTPFNVKCNKIMVGGDPVQQTGATDLAAYIPPDLMPTSLIKIDSGKEGTYKKNLLQIAKSTALIIVQAVLAAKGIILPINPISQAQNIKNNTGKLVSNARHAHRDCYFDKTDDLPNYTIMSNASNDPANYQLNQELSTKIPVFTNGYYKKFKKMAYSMCGIISEKLHKVKEKTTPVITTVDNLPNSIHTQQAKQLMDHIKNIGQSLVDDPRGRTKLITSSREKLLRKVVTPAQKRIAPDKPSLDNL